MLFEVSTPSELRIVYEIRQYDNAVATPQMSIAKERRVTRMPSDV
jgi:hypothetical protein